MGSFTLDYGQAVEAAKGGAMMQPDHYGVGWALVATNDGALWDRNPYTGSMLQHCEDVRCMKAAWRRIWFHEYAGFRYQMHREDGRWKATPLEQQHPAATRQKHVMAAAEDFADTEDARNAH